MKYYLFNEFGFISGSREAQLNPESGKTIKTLNDESVVIPISYLGCGKNETAEVPWPEESGKINYFDGSKWELVDDNRGKQVWNTNELGQSKFVDADNLISDGWTLLEYKAYHKWNGTEWIVDTTKKQEIIAVLDAKIESLMEANILNNFEFSGKKFYLSEKNQFKYKAEYDIRENLTYPHRVKCVDGYYDIQTTEEHQAWYLGGLQLVRECEVAAWNEVDALQNKTTAELIELLNP